MVRAYHETFGLPITITNCANTYGPFQFPEKVIPLFATRALCDRPLPVYASSQNRREWVHVLDHCRAIETVIERGLEGETYHVGSGVEKSVAQIADLVLDLLGKPGSLKLTVPDRPGHERRHALDWTRIRRELGWRPEVNFDQGLVETVGWSPTIGAGGSRSSCARRSTRRWPGITEWPPRARLGRRVGRSRCANRASVEARPATRSWRHRVLRRPRYDRRPETQWRRVQSRARSKD